MSTDTPRTIFVATDEGLHLFTDEDAARVDDLAGRGAGARGVW
jgi:hypothetical protein